MSDSFPFPIIDPHVHYWDVRHTPRQLTWPRRLLGWNRWLYRRAVQIGARDSERNFLGQFDYVMWDYLPAEYSADAIGIPVEQLVHIEAAWGDRSPLGPAEETRWLHGRCSEISRPQLGGIVAHADLRQPHLPQLLNAHLAASNRLRGIRQMLAWDEDPGVMSFCDRPLISLARDFRCGLANLHDCGLTFDAWAFHHQLAEVIDLAREFPTQLFILNHMGTPIGLGGPFASYGHSTTERDTILKNWQASLAELADYSNVMVKLSGFFMPIVGWGFERREQPVSHHELLDAFAPHAQFVLQQLGVQRCMFASNFPMDKVSLSFNQLYQVYLATVTAFDHHEQRLLFADNARRIYRLT